MWFVPERCGAAGLVGYGMVGSCTVCLGLAGELWLGWERFCADRSCMVWYCCRGESCKGESCLGDVWFCEAGKVGTGSARRCMARFGISGMVT